jgi:hypothetical protein
MLQTISQETNIKKKKKKLELGRFNLSIPDDLLITRKHTYMKKKP